MSDDKKYYYLKLKENFFDSPEMKVLESMENGYMYSNILLKLYLKSLKNEGKLVISDKIPLSVKMISAITGHNIDVVEHSLVAFTELNLIEKLDNGTIFMADIQNFIGKSSTEGDRKREYRKRIEYESGHLSDKHPPELELELEKEIELEKRKAFTRPTIPQISSYIKKKGFSVDPELFHNHYSSNGWKVGGRAAMKDWEAAVRTWEKRGKTPKDGTINNRAKEEYKHFDE